MKEILKIHKQFWSLFQSGNRYIYMETLILIYDEYLYNDFFLTKESCIQLISEHFQDVYEPMATKILNRLIKFTWLKKVEDYSSFKTNIILPDYSSLFIEVLKRILNPDESDTDLYIQNVYTNIYSFYHDNKAGLELLRSALVNTTRLNRSLQDMLHNMDRFFSALLEKENYEALLAEHLTVYVETIVNKKYSILKTSDNFYIYKNDIKKLLRLIQEDEGRIGILMQKMSMEGKNSEDAHNELSELIYGLEHGIINMEKRISHIDTEHSKYVRATVGRLERLLNLLGREEQSEILKQTADSMGLNDLTVITPDSIYKKRGKNKVFEETVEAIEEVEEELSKDEILMVNRSKNRYSKEQIESFVLNRMENGIFSTKDDPVKTEEEFELLILAYDYSIRKSSPFYAIPGDKGSIRNDKFLYPDMIFKRK